MTRLLTFAAVLLWVLYGIAVVVVCSFTVVLYGAVTHP